MASNVCVLARGFQRVVQGLDEAMLHFDLAPAHTADKMVMIFTGDLIRQVPPSRLSRPHETIVCKELESAVYRWFGQGRVIPFGSRVYIARGEMPARMSQDVQDGHALPGDAVSAHAKLGGIFRSTRHDRFLLQVYTITLFHRTLHRMESYNENASRVSAGIMDIVG